MKTLIKLGILFLFSIILLPQQMTACDSTPVIDISSAMDLGNGNFEIDLQVCIGDGGSLDGFTTTFPAPFNIVSFTPASLVNGANVAVGTNTTSVLDYNYAAGSSANMFAAANTNTCFNYSVTIDADPTGINVDFIGVNCQTDQCPGSCAFIGGNIQTTVVPEGATALTCGDAFSDGATNYANSANDSYFICPTTPGDPVTIDFSVFDLESGYDFMNIYDSNTIGTSPITGSPFTGTNSPGIITATNLNGCFVVVFTSDGSVTDIGWDATISCDTPFACGDTFTDGAGNYPNSANDTHIFCSDDPTLTFVSLDFSVFDLETNFDFMTIYDNDNASGTSTQYTGTNSPGVVTAINTTGCLTIVFTSDGSVNDVGWEAIINCVLPPPDFVCGDVFTDGVGNYANSANEEYSICSDVPSVPVTLDFSIFDLESNFDFLNIYDSATAGTSPIAGSPFTGLNSPGTVTSTNGANCLTVVFTSDGSVNDVGWEATVSCCTPISFAEVVNCNAGTGTSTVIITGGAPAYTLVNTGAGTLSTTSVANDGGIVAITGLINADNYSFDLTDNGGCTESFSGTFVDVTPPTPFCQNLTVSLDPVTYSVSITTADIDNGSSDNCSVSLSLSNDTFGCDHIGDNIVTLTVTDPSGNSATCDATVTINGFPVGFTR
jgi:hypothetical protein